MQNLTPETQEIDIEGLKISKMKVWLRHWRVIFTVSWMELTLGQVQKYPI
jgi:hypothetical protein